ncbi:MAG: hypothetical protein WAR78_02505 [Ferruginibacter sp.]
MKKKWFNGLLSLLITVSGTAQTAGYTFYSRSDTVISAGFYNIALTPGITAHCKTDYSDIRIVNEAGKWIPHILHTPAHKTTNHELMMDMEFSVTENSGTNTIIIIDAVQKTANNMGLVISNTAAERFCTLSGTNDKKNWFVINDSILLNPVAAQHATENIFRINFPQTSYTFYKIVIHNNNKDPFNIKGVVTYTPAPEMANPLHKLNENPETVIQQKDSGKITYIKITQQLPFHFDHIRLQVDGIKYYNRKVELYIPYTANSSFADPGQPVQSFTVSNNSTLQFNVPLSNAPVFYVLINNEDNQPLTVKAIKTACSNHYITAYLDSGSNYKLIMGNAGALLPNYDLGKLNSSIPDSISFLPFGKITAFSENTPPANTTDNNKWILWTAIAAALLILLFFSYKMLTEVDKQKKA